MARSDPILAIDFGTAYCRMAWAVPESGRAELIRDAEGNLATPSVVYFGADRVAAGVSAEAMLEVAAERHRAIRRAKLKLADGGNRSISLPGRRIAVASVAAEMIRKLKWDAEQGEVGASLLSGTFSAAVITWPGGYNRLYREALASAAADAGLRAELISDAEAAAVACIAAGLRLGKTVLVVDIGAVRMHLSLITRTAIGSYVVVLSAESPRECGGDAVTDLLYDYLNERAEEQCGQRIAADGRSRDLGVLRAVGRYKESLSRQDNILVDLEYGNGLRLPRLEVSCDRLEELIERKWIGAVRVMIRAMRNAARSKKLEVDSAILNGGSVCIPAVRRELQAALGDLDVAVLPYPDATGALGAAIYGADGWPPAKPARRRPKCARDSFVSSSLRAVLDLADRGEYDRALEIVDAVCDYCPESPDAFCWKGYIFWKKGERLRSLSLLSHCIDLDTEHRAAYRLRGCLNLEIGDFCQARDDFGRHLAVAGRRDVYAFRALASIGCEDPVHALADVRRALLTHRVAEELPDLLRNREPLFARACHGWDLPQPAIAALHTFAGYLLHELERPTEARHCLIEARAALLESDTVSPEYATQFGAWCKKARIPSDDEGEASPSPTAIVEGLLWRVCRSEHGGATKEAFASFSRHVGDRTEAPTKIHRFVWRDDPTFALLAASHRAEEYSVESALAWLKELYAIAPGFDIAHLVQDTAICLLENRRIEALIGERYAKRALAALESKIGDESTALQDLLDAVTFPESDETPHAALYYLIAAIESRDKEVDWPRSSLRFLRNSLEALPNAPSPGYVARFGACLEQAGSEAQGAPRTIVHSLQWQLCAKAWDVSLRAAKHFMSAAIEPIDDAVWAGYPELAFLLARLHAKHGTDVADVRRWLERLFRADRAYDSVRVADDRWIGRRIDHPALKGFVRDRLFDMAVRDIEAKRFPESLLPLRRASALTQAGEIRFSALRAIEAYLLVARLARPAEGLDSVVLALRALPAGGGSPEDEVVFASLWSRSVFTIVSGRGAEEILQRICWDACKALHGGCTRQAASAFKSSLPSRSVRPTAWETDPQCGFYLASLFAEENDASSTLALVKDFLAARKDGSVRDLKKDPWIEAAIRNDRALREYLTPKYGWYLPGFFKRNRIVVENCSPFRLTEVYIRVYYSKHREQGELQGSPFIVRNMKPGEKTVVNVAFEKGEQLEVDLECAEGTARSLGRLK